MSMDVCDCSCVCVCALYERRVEWANNLTLLSLSLILVHSTVARFLLQNLWLLHAIKVLPYQMPLALNFQMY